MARGLAVRRKRKERRCLGEAVPSQHADAERRKPFVSARRNRRAADKHPLKPPDAMLLALRREDVGKRWDKKRKVHAEAVHSVVYAPEIGADAKRDAVHEHQVSRRDSEDVVEREEHERTVGRPHLEHLAAGFRKRLYRRESKLRPARNRRRSACKDHRRDSRGSILLNPLGAWAVPKSERLVRMPALHEAVGGKRAEPDAQDVRHAARDLERLFAV